MSDHYLDMARAAEAAALKRREDEAQKKADEAQRRQEKRDAEMARLNSVALKPLTDALQGFRDSGLTVSWINPSFMQRRPEIGIMIGSSQARHVDLSVEVRDGGYVIAINDNGIRQTAEPQSMHIVEALDSMLNRMVELWYEGQDRPSC
jgi:hypothetical protein